MRTSSSRHMFHEAPFTHTPGFFFATSFCVKCALQKKTKGGQRKGQAKLFVCSDCCAPKEGVANGQRS